MLRKLLIFSFFAALAGCGFLPASAQTAPATAAASLPAAPSPPAAVPGFTWDRVESLPSGTRMYVQARSTTTCNFNSATAETLTCTEGIGGNPITFQRAEIRKTKLSRRGHSAWVGLGIGFGVGLIVGEIVGSQHEDTGRGLGGFVGAFAGSIYGPIVGYFTDFTRSTLYKAP